MQREGIPFTVKHLRYDTRMNRLMAQIGYTFTDTGLLNMALTHPSYGGPDNQRLEFLGDAVLEFLISERLYHYCPQEREGSLTYKRARLVCEASLSSIAGQIGLGEYLLIGKVEEMTQGRRKRSILADAMEALIAAVYLDGGIDSARALAARLWPSLEAPRTVPENSKGDLQVFLQARGEPAPRYHTDSAEGPPHDRLFHVSVYAGDTALASGSGKSKKEAEQRAAYAAFKALTEEGAAP
jgi:ribonuclease-3